MRADSLTRITQNSSSTPTRPARRGWLTAALATAFAFAGVMPAAAFAAPTEISVWHAMDPAHRATFEELVQRFNSQQNDVHVTATAYASVAQLAGAGETAVLAKKQPNMIELSDTAVPEFVARHNAITPMSDLLKSYPVKDLNFFLPQTTNYLRDARGNLLALPWMAEAPVYIYNRDLYKKAGLNPDVAPKTWREMQGHLVALANVAESDCPYATSRESWIHLENTSALHNVPFASKNNGLETNGVGAELQINQLLHVRHLALMMSWVRSRLFTFQSHEYEADAKFITGECAVLTTGTGSLGAIQQQAKFSYGVAPLPYYDEEAKNGSNPFVGGPAFWAMSGHPAAEQKALATFIAYLASPVTAAEWHQKTGFLPLSDAAFRASSVSYYPSLPGSQAVIRELQQTPAQYTRGFRLHNYTMVSDIMDQELDNIFSGRKPPKQGLDDAVARGNAVMRASGAPTGAAIGKPGAAPRPAVKPAAGAAKPAAKPAAAPAKPAPKPAAKPAAAPAKPAAKP